MIVGSGSSKLGQFLYERGFHYITNVDFSPTIVSFMSEHNKHFEEMEYSIMDICEDSLDGMEE